MKQSLSLEVRWPRRVVTPADAVRFIDAVGYCLLFPIKNLPLPSLYYAVARRYIHLGPGWDKYCEKIWEWKGSLGGQRRAFYTKYFKGRGTFISLKLLPHFLAMLDSAADATQAEAFYRAGKISADARAIWDGLAAHGPLATLELRHACRMDSKPGNARFKRAMAKLQCLLLVFYSGAEQETAAWPSGRFELTAHAFPRQIRDARRVTPEQARAALAHQYLEWHPDAPPQLLARLFGWSKAEALAACNV